MKVGLILMPPFPREYPSYDMALTAAILRRAEHEVRVFDLNNGIFLETYKQRPNWKFQFTTAAEVPAKVIFRHERELFEEWANKLVAEKLDVLIFKSLPNTLVNAENIAFMIKRKEPTARTIFSGEINPDLGALEKIVRTQHNKSFDHFIFGEDDIMLPRLLACIERGDFRGLGEGCKINGKVIDTTRGPRVQNLDEFPHYDFSDYDTMNYGRPNALEVVWSRGCPWHCAFCQDWFERGKFRCMSGERIFREFRHQIEKHPTVNYIHSYDRTMNGDPAALETFCDCMIAHFAEPKVVWAGDIMVRPEMTSGLIDKMRRAGCRGVGVGFESGSHRVRASMDKGSFSNDLAFRIFSDFNKNHIAVSLNIMVGFPTETREDFRETLAFLDRLAGACREEWAWDIRLTFATARIGRATNLYTYAPRYNIAIGADGDVHNEKWVSADGSNTFDERVQRFRELCDHVLEQRMKLTVNRRMIKNQTAVDRLVRELVTETELRAS